MAVNTEAKKRVFWICVLASLGGLLFGLDQGFINGSLGFIQKTFKWTTAQGESFASIILIGAIIGAFFSGFISNAIGRRNTLLLAAMIFSVFTIWGASTHSPAVLYFTRVCLGFAVGSASFVVPIYLSEIAPAKVRGGYISLYQFSITIDYVSPAWCPDGACWQWCLAYPALYNCHPCSGTPSCSILKTHLRQTFQER